jgi:GntR family transcriptional repressor for pyruvate dehydrogenase complex
MPQTPPAAAPRRARSLTQVLVEGLSGRIASRDLSPGDKLPTESAMMGEYGVSRTVVREAISRLQASGLVETRQGVGTFVLARPAQAPFRVDPAELATVADLISLLELRISVEAEAASLAAMRRSDEDLAALRESLDAYERGVQRADDAIDPDFEFHLRIARAARNRYFVDLMNHLGKVVIPRTRVNSARLAQEERSEYLRRVGREHDDIYSAIARRDPDAARAAMRTHLSNSRERLKRAHEAALSRTMSDH